MKQTAVQWLVNEMREYDWWYLPESMKEDIIDQAKAMEKEQIIKAFNQSWHDRMNPYKTAEKYYTETYESNN